jgi:4-hydroxybenzoyl-CoA thioesterase
MAFARARGHDAGMAHVVEIAIRFGHVDQAKIVYYPHLFHFGHEAMEETFRQVVGISYPDLIAKERLGFPSVHLETDFVETVGYGETLRIAVSVLEIGRTSVTWRFEGSRSSDGVVAFRTKVTTVCVDMDRFRPVPIPEKFRPALESLRAAT